IGNPIRDTCASKNKAGLTKQSAAYFHHLPSSGAFQLPSCQPIKHMVSLEKRGCPRCHSVETTICSGHCPTKDPVAKVLFHKLFQHVCVYGEVYYKTFQIPDCPPGIDPTVVYPVALSCHCGRCNMNTSDCTSHSLRPDFCLNDILNYS
uniref:Gonadotropin subunit beta-2 n=1 Tax=Salarias fasciatus TaxID=181472 RepID=A0A672H2T3_SALFA